MLLATSSLRVAERSFQVFFHIFNAGWAGGEGAVVEEGGLDSVLVLPPAHVGREVCGSSS